MKMCVLDFDKECDNCGECEMCDLDPTKKCDNCCHCLELNGEKAYREVNIADYAKAVAKEDMFTDMLFSDAYGFRKPTKYLRLNARGKR